MDNDLNIYGLVLPGKDRQSTLEAMADYLHHKNIVAENYIDLLLKREEEYPTGLPCEPIAVAIPHADRDSVYESSILVAKLETDVDFHRMDLPQDTVSVKLIFMLAIDSNDQQLEMISQVMKVVQDGDLLNRLYNAEAKEDLEEILSDFFASSGNRDCV